MKKTESTLEPRSTMNAWVRGSATSGEGDPDLEDRFCGRWNPRRALQPDLRALASAVAEATAAAGWWEPGSTASAGLVLGVDLHGWGHMEQFEGTLRTLAEGKTATLRPSVFLYALPSTPAATLGLLFGLEDYQATVNQHGASGFAALAHAMDLLALRRLRRVVVAALSAVCPDVASRLPDGAGAFRLATALCLETTGPPADVGFARCAVGRGLIPPASAIESETLLSDLPPGYRVLCAPSLLAACRVEVNNTLVHRDPCFGGLGVLDVVAGLEG